MDQAQMLKIPSWTQPKHLPLANTVGSRGNLRLVFLCVLVSNSRQVLNFVDLRKKNPGFAYFSLCSQQVLELGLVLLGLIVFAVKPVLVSQFVIDDFIRLEK